MGRPEYDAHDVKNIAMRQEWCYVKTFWKDYGRMITFLRDGVQINIYLRSGNVAMCLENDREGKSHQTRKKINTKSKLGNLLMNPGVTYKQLTIADAEESQCKYYKTNECRYGERCVYVHASPCNQCGRNCLHPTHKPQRRFHRKNCLKKDQNGLEHSFTVKMKEKTCGICLDVVQEKPKEEAMFGILSSCTHCFCFSCIKTWQARQGEDIVHCPECRQVSNILKSSVWTEDSQEKQILSKM